VKRELELEQLVVKPGGHAGRKLILRVGEPPVDHQRRLVKAHQLPAQPAPATAALRFGPGAEQVNRCADRGARPRGEGPAAAGKQATGNGVEDRRSQHEVRGHREPRDRGQPVQLVEPQLPAGQEAEQVADEQHVPVDECSGAKPGYELARVYPHGHDQREDDQTERVAADELDPEGEHRQKGER